MAQTRLSQKPCQGQERSPEVPRPKALHGATAFHFDSEDSRKPQAPRIGLREESSLAAQLETGTASSSTCRISTVSRTKTIRPNPSTASGQSRLSATWRPRAEDGIFGVMRLPSDGIFGVTRLPSAIDPVHHLRSGQTVVEMEGDFKELYKIEAKLGEGGFGQVHRVRRISSGEVFAMKSIPAYKVNSPDEFEKELAITRKLSHPFIVQLHVTFRDPEAFHLIMDLCTGGDLLEKLEDSFFASGGTARSGGFAAFYLAPLIWQMLSGIAYLHNYGICHRDVKLENYLLMSKAEDASLKLIDFGVARIFVKGRKMRTRCGSIFYVAPEVVKGSYDELCDVWSVGVTAYALATAVFPFNAENEDKILESIVEAEVQFPTDIWKRHPKELQALLRRLLSKDPEQRPSAAQIIAESHWLQRHGAPDRRPESCCAVA